MSKNNEPDIQYEKVSPIGIDFGTTNSSIAYAVPNANDNIEPRAVVHDDIYPKIPTAVFIKDSIRVDNGSEILDREYIVGDEALELGAQYPEKLHKEFKRDLIKNQEPLDDDSEVDVNLLTTQVFKYLFQHAEKEGYKDIIPVVCHPVGSKWASVIDQILRDNLNTHAIMLTEPEAALYYAHHKYHVFDEKDETLLLIDFGGGTCDFLLMNIQTSFWKRLLTRPYPTHIDDDRLDFAGQDIDEIILNHWKKQWLAENPNLEKHIDDFEQPMLAWTLKKKAVEVKHRLSKNYAKGRKFEELTIEISDFPGNSKFRTTMTPADLQELTEPIIEQLFRKLLLEKDGVNNQEAFLGRKKVYPDDVTMIILTGGSGQLPWISESILPKLFPSLANQGHILKLENPAMSVSYGAALYAHDLSKQKQRMQKFLQEDLKIKLDNGKVHTLINRGASLPIKGKLFKTLGYETFDFPQTGRKLSIKLIATSGHRATNHRPLSYKEKFAEFEEDIPEGTPMDMEVTIDEKGGVHLSISKAGFWQSKVKAKPIHFPPLEIGTNKGGSA